MATSITLKNGEQVKINGNYLSFGPFVLVWSHPINFTFFPHFYFQPHESRPRLLFPQLVHP